MNKTYERMAQLIILEAEALEDDPSRTGSGMGKRVKDDAEDDARELEEIKRKRKLRKRLSAIKAAKKLAGLG